MDANDRLLRLRAIEELVFLAASPEEQLPRLNDHNNELIDQWLNWEVSFLPRLAANGAMTADTVRTTDAVTHGLERMSEACQSEYRLTGSIPLLSAEGIRQDPRWAHIRALACEALAAFERLGMPIPRLTDADYNIPRDDAP